MSAAVEIRPNPDGSIDEIVADNCSVHIEQMDNKTFWMGITAADGSLWHFWIKTREIKHTETDPPHTVSTSVPST